MTYLFVAKFLTAIVYTRVQDLLKELEEFAFKGIPDLRGYSDEAAVCGEEMVIKSFQVFFIFFERAR